MDTLPLYHSLVSVARKQLCSRVGRAVYTLVLPSFLAEHYKCNEEVVKLFVVISLVWNIVLERKCNLM